MAISVLSAVEGLKVVAPGVEPFIVPLSIAILIGLFAFQQYGTGKVATFFGPITAVWFVAIAIGGAIHIADNPSILAAINPVYGVNFLLTQGHIGFLTLGAVFLAVTGAEALYADLGHFGCKPIQFAWIAFVFAALAINYLGQGALLLASPEKIENPFFLLYPGWAVLPMIVLATAATVIASQAVITGAYSLTQQAMQLGLLPRFHVWRTSETQSGQIYLPRINWILLTMVLLIVGIFRTSSALACCLRHRCNGNDGGYDHHGIHRGVEVLALVAVAHCAFDRAAPGGRRGVPGRESGEDRRGRLDAAAHWCGPDHCYADMAARLASAGHQDAAHRCAARRLDRDAREAPAGSADAGHRRVPHGASGNGADGAAA